MATADARAVTARLTWLDADVAAADAGDVGIQDAAGALLDGRRRAEGSHVHIQYEVQIQLRPPRSAVVAGLDLGGPYVHGVAGERFLYLSYPGPGEEPWRRRVKIMLPRSVELDCQGLAVRLRVAEAVRAVLEQPGWVGSR